MTPGHRIGSGSAGTHQEQRRRLRKRLRARGYDEATIDAIVAARAEDQRRRRETAAEAGERIARHREQEAALLAKAAIEEPFNPPDDAGYRPPHVDPLLVGRARVSGQTAQVVKRRTTVTKWEHDGRPE